MASFEATASSGESETSGMHNSWILDSWDHYAIEEQGAHVRRAGMPQNECLDIEICIDDWLRNEMVFPMSLVNRAPSAEEAGVGRFWHE
jgi:hypothetical protein